ncbi:hypothetical protein XENORESO_006392 [Xenotaenia resolanae]|uniref:Uncharacterized protein n=1 Tax=Xenotaenia resolanae TaxID=208358 RepID=A0ABV0W7G6_9TELE
MGCSSARQKSFNFSPCKLHLTCSSREFCLLTCWRASQRFFSAKLDGGGDLDPFLLQTGHSRILVSQHCFRQLLQKLWLHDSRTGSLKMSQHTGHVRSSSGRDMIITLYMINAQIIKERSSCVGSSVSGNSTSPVKVSGCSNCKLIHCS